MKDEAKEIMILFLTAAVTSFIASVAVVGIYNVFFGTPEPEYAIVEDNAIETIISIKQGDDLTLLNINRYEDGGGLWEVTYDGKNEPVTRRVE